MNRASLCLYVLAIALLSPMALLTLEAVFYRRVIQPRCSEEETAAYDRSLRTGKRISSIVIQAAMIGVLLLGAAITLEGIWRN